MGQLSVPYSIYAHDPENQVPGGCAAYCIACGVHTDLVLRGTNFLCADQELCQLRVRRIVTRQAPDPTRRSA